MPESEAVYQPTTVGYSYEAGGDVNDAGNGIRNGFSRIIFRHKVSTRKWAEWVLLSVALCASVAGLAMVLVYLMAPGDDSPPFVPADQDKSKNADGGAVDERLEDDSRGSVAVGATIMLSGLLMGCAWAWLRFFRPSKSPRGGMARGSGQMLGGLNPSTDLLVGSTSQYGPVLTEVPSRMMPTKTVNPHDARTAIPLSDQEEETRTLMPDSAVPAVAVPVTGGDKNSATAANSQIAG